MKGDPGFFWLAGENGLDLRDLVVSQRSIPARLKCWVQHQRAHAFAVQGGNLVVEVAKHALDLMVAALVQGEAGLV